MSIFIERSVTTKIDQYVFLSIQIGLYGYLFYKFSRQSGSILVSRELRHFTGKG